jgi:hypothetical protein
MLTRGQEGKLKQEEEKFHKVFLLDPSLHQFWLLIDP